MLNHHLRRVSALVVALLGAGVLLAAHPGHDHKLMGTITAIDKNHVTVETTDGTARSFEVTPTTKLLRGKVRGTVQELKVGMRIVANVGTGQEPLRAKELQYTGVPTTKSRN